MHDVDQTVGELELVQHFQEFIDQATPIATDDAASEERVATDDAEKEERLVSEFRQFIDKAMPLVLAEVKALLPEIARRAAHVWKWMVRHDLLEIANCSRVENAYTELMAWALRPVTHPESGIQRQVSWLRMMRLDGAIMPAAPCEPQTQLRTDDGIPDMVLDYPEGAIVVEAKVGTLEHEAPSGLMQTLAYVEAVRRKLSLPSDKQVMVIFLSPAGMQAANEEATCTTYADFVVAMAEALEGCEIPFDLRAAFSILFTHFLAVSGSATFTVYQLIEAIVDWSKQPDWRSDSQVNRHLPRLIEAVQVLSPERRV